MHPMRVITGKVQTTCAQGKGAWLTARTLNANTAESAAMEKKAKMVPGPATLGVTNSRAAPRRNARRVWAQKCSPLGRQKKRTAKTKTSSSPTAKDQIPG